MIDSVFVIDDQKIDLMLAVRALERSGLVRRIEAFRCPAEALSALTCATRQRPDLILVDVHMPAMDVFEFVERAHIGVGADCAGAIYVMQSLELNESDIQRLRAHETVRGCVEKPLQLKDVRAIDAALNTLSAA